MKFRPVMVPLLVGSIFAASSCGSDNAGRDQSAVSTVKAPTGSVAVGGNVATEAAKMVAQFTQLPNSFPGPTKPFHPVTGRAAVMSCGFAAEVCKVNGDIAVEAFKAMGWEVAPNFDGQFSPQIQAGFIDRAVEQGLDGVVLASGDVNTIKESVDRAVKAGLFIACVFCASGHEWDGKVYDVSPNWAGQGEIVSWAIIANSGSRAKVVSFQDNAFTTTILRAKGLEDGLAKNCPDCTYKRELFATADIAQPGPPQVAALVASNSPGQITNLVAHYDGLGMAAAKTIKDSGRKDITVSGYDADSVAANAIITGEPAPYGWSVAGPFNYAMWAAVDMVARHKAGVELWPNWDQMPSVLIDKSNAALYIKETPGPPNYKQFFLHLWGK